MIENFVFIDTETEGINPKKHRLLSIALIIWNSSEGILAQKKIFIKYRRYALTEEAQNITNFNKEKHELNAIYKKVAIEEIVKFLSMYFKNKKVILIGQNVSFDVSFLKKFFERSKYLFDEIFSHRSIDTFSIYKSLSIAGKINDTINSSDEIFNYFKIAIQERHTALGDCMATVKLYEKLIQMIK